MIKHEPMKQHDAKPLRRLKSRAGNTEYVRLDNGMIVRATPKRWENKKARRRGIKAAEALNILEV